MGNPSGDIRTILTRSQGSLAAWGGISRQVRLQPDLALIPRSLAGQKLHRVDELPV